MEYLFFGFLFFLAFVCGLMLSFLVFGFRREDLEKPMAAQIPVELPPMDDKLKKQYDNLFRYNGTERGQMSLE